MIWNSLRSVFVLLIFSGLVACGGFESQAKLSLTPVPSSTSSPTLTNTPEPTGTTLPTDTPAPTPTATITPTPTPQIGETRINPETGQEEVFSDPGEWLEIVKIWNVAEMGELPRGMTRDNSSGLTKENASFEEKEGTIVLSWTKDWDEEAEDFGQKYELLIPTREEDLYNSDGNKESTELKVVFSLDGNIEPSITMISKQGEMLAKWDIKQEQWNDKFDLVLDNLGEQKLESWMPQELGYIGGYTFDSEWGDHIAMSIMVKPKKIIAEQLFWQGEISKKIYILIAEFDDIGHTIHTVLFSDQDPHSSSILEVDKSSNLNLINTPMAINASDGPSRKLPSVLELVEKSPRANMILISNPEELIALFDNEYKNKSKPVPGRSIGPGGNSTYYWSERFEQEYENHLDQIEFAKNMSEEGSTNVDEVWWGFWAMAFLTTSEN